MSEERRETERKVEWRDEWKGTACDSSLKSLPVSVVHPQILGIACQLLPFVSSFVGLVTRPSCLTLLTPYERSRRWTGVTGVRCEGETNEGHHLRPPSHSIRLRHVVESERSEHGTEWPEVNETRGQQNQGSKIDRRDGFSVFLPSRPLPHHSPSFHPPFRRRRGGERWVSGVEGM